MIAGASAALSLQVAARWAFAGAATSWTQRPVTGQGTLVDGAAVLIVVLMATFTVADLDWVALRERAVEVRTLRAIGWSALDLARLTLRERGLAGPGAAALSRAGPTSWSAFPRPAPRRCG